MTMRRARGAKGLTITMALAIACSGAGESQMPTAPTRTRAPEGWLTYSDPTYAFAISYPSNFVILPDSTSPTPGSVKQVRFQDRQIATSPFADREPERFRIDVFSWAQPTPLEAWLRSVGRLPADADVSSFPWIGAREAVAVRQRSALSPNEFFYFATSKWVYALTPSADGSTMLGTFELKP
jgi:hypothetical protein